MNRAILGVAGVMAGLAVVACGSAAASSGATSTPSPSAGARRGLAGNAAFESAFHQKPRQAVKLWNGPIPCTLYGYDAPG